MEAPRLSLKQTRPRTTFKENAGQNNHFLITILVGLDAVGAGCAVRNPGFSTTWEPRDLGASAARSREFAIKSSLSWIVDLLNVYRKEVSSIAGSSVGARLRKLDDLDGAETKLMGLVQVAGLSQSPEVLLSRLAINWRNRTVHSSSAGRRLNRTLASQLMACRSELLEQHSGLDVELTIERHDNGRAPTFKDVATIISGIQRTVRDIDAALISLIDLESFADDVIRRYLAESKDSNVVPKLWPGSPDKTRQRLTTLLGQHGMTESEDPRDAVLAANYLSDLASLTPRQAKQRYLAVEPSS